MLILTRKVGESIIIELPDGELVTVILKERRNSNSVRLGIDAPKHIPIFRSGVFDAMHGDTPKMHVDARVGTDISFATSWGEKVKRWACLCDDEHTGARSHAWAQPDCARCGARRP